MNRDVVWYKDVSWCIGRFKIFVIDVLFSSNYLNIC